MVDVIDERQIADEVKRATRLAKRVKRPRGVHGLTVEPDEDHEGNPKLVISVEVDDDPDDPSPSSKRLDELIDYDRAVTSKIWSGEFVSWPSVRFVSRK